MEYKVITTIEYEMTVEPPELPEAPKGTNGFDVDEISENLGNVITEYLTEQAHSVWVDTSKSVINELPEDYRIRHAMKELLNRFSVPTEWLNEALDCIDNWVLDDSLMHYNEECTIEEGY